jgi:hypothetical protein
MKTINPLNVLGIVDGLLTPIQRIISEVLPDFIQDALEDDAVRDKIVEAVDKQLIKQYPAARLIPEKRRRRIIRKILDIMLDDILLEESA